MTMRKYTSLPSMNEHENIIRELYGMYAASFPQLDCGYDKFYETFSDVKVLVESNGFIKGFCFVYENSVPLLCVRKEYVNTGIGSALLAQAERHIKSNGYSHVVLGEGEKSIFQGVPLSSESCTADFFVKRGYSAEWVSEDLVHDITAFDINDYAFLKKPENVEFRLFRESDGKENLLVTVGKIDTDWVRYYKNTDSPIMIAVKNNAIIGCEILDTDMTFSYSFDGKTGGIGCVGIIPQERGNGTGLYMVACGILKLRESGVKYNYIGCTHLSRWYGKLGAKVYARFWMGGKIL